MQQQNRITYRFDSNGKKIDSLPQQPSVVHEVASTQQLNIEQLEQLIREADGVIAHTDEEHDVPYIARPEIEKQPRMRYELDLEELEEWQQVRIPDEDQSQQPEWSPLIIDDVQPTKVKQRFNWTHGLVAVLCAVLTGTLLGYLLLVQVFGSVLWPGDKSTESMIVEETVVDRTDVVPTTDDNLPTVAIDMTKTQYSYQLLQAGVFGKENTRDEVILALKNAGYAAVYTQENNGKYFVYAAMATSANNIEPLKADVTGFELYRKELVLHLPKKLQYDGEAAQLGAYIESSNQLIGMYADLVAAQLEQPTLSVIGPSAQQASQTQYDQWEKISQEAIGGFKGTASESLAAQLQQSLQLAQEQMLKYQEKPNAKHIWSVEEAIVKAVLIQKEWFEHVNGLS